MNRSKKLAGAFLVASGTALLPSAASAAVSCDYIAGNKLVLIGLFSSGDSGTIARSGSAITVNGAPCDSATVTNTNLIAITDQSGESVSVEIDLRPGPFRPGAADEPGASDEIEFDISFGTEGFDELVIRGGDGPDHIVLGSEGINLNAGETTGMDPDVSLELRGGARVLGGEGADTLSSRGDRGTGGRIDATLPFSGGPGNDLLTTGEVTVPSGVFFICPPLEAVSGGPGNDVLRTGVLCDVLAGGEGDDVLFAGGGDDEVLGGSDRDVLVGGPGDDDLDGGGAGDDRDAADFRSARAGVEVALGPGEARGEGDDTLQELEGVRGGPHGDSIVGSTASNRLEGAGGPDRIRGWEATDRLIGEAGDDVLLGEGGDDDLEGGAGRDTASYEDHPGVIEANLETGVVFEGGTAESIAGIENLIGGNSADRLVGDGGPNEIDGRNGEDELVGGGGRDFLDGGGLGDEILGGSDSDTLIGDHGADVLQGGGAGDTADYSRTFGPMTIDLGAGTATGESGPDTLSSVERAIGTRFADDLLGSGGANVLDGSHGADEIEGRGGSDRLIGGPGTDELRGGTCADTGDYGPAPGPVAVKLSKTGLQDTGATGHDDLAGLERLIGSRFGDLLKGDGGANRLTGGAGGDVLKGLAGPDLLLGQAGADDLNGGDGSDECRGGPGADSESNCES